MKKSRNIILSVLLAVCAVCLCFALVGCGNKDKDETPKYGYGEEGFYYYDGADSSRYMLSLQSGTYMITVNNNTAYSGTYSYDEESGTVSFKGDNEFAAVLGDSALSLDVEESGYSFKAYRFFDVSYVDESGKTVYTDSVLNGQSPANVSGEGLKDGYWFIDWYVDSSNSAVYSFDTSIAGDTVIYGWFIEKNSEAVEHTVTLDYGDGVTDVWDTTNGAIFKTLPESHDGKEIAGWWVSATNKGDELTYKYTSGGIFTADTTLYAVYATDSILASSVTAGGITWDAANAGSSVTITICDATGKEVVSGTATSSSGIYTSSAFTALEAGTYTVTVTSGSIAETRVYVVNGLSRVTLSESDIIINGSGRVISFAPVDGADGYRITVTNGEKTITEDLGSHTYYNFSDWEMTKDGITFVVTAYADGYADSVSDGFTYLLVLGNVTIDISDDTVSWNHVDGALEYVVTITDTDGNVIDSFRTSDTSFSLKYYENGTYDITVQPHTDGYYSEAKTYYGYAKDSLMAPQITDVTNYTVSWEPVVGADSYVVLINGVEYTTTETTLVFSTSNVPTTAGSYEISVKAVKEDGSSSPYSDAVVATVEFSSAVSYDRNTIYWDYDIAAAYYGISVNGTEETKTEGGHSFKVTLTKAGDNVITVTAYDEDGASLGSAEITVYAYSVILDPNGASLVNAAADENNTIYVAQGDELNLGTVEKTYADFMGWYTQPDFTNGQSDEYEGIGSLVSEGSTFTGSGSMYLYAYWTYQYIDVTLEVGSGTLVDENGNEITSVKIKYNSRSFTLPVPASESAENIFGGWYVASTRTSTKYADETGASEGTAFMGETTLYAVYVTAFSYQRATYNGQVVYSVSAGSEISSLKEITIPETYNGYKIMLGSSAFSNCTGLEVINLPDTVPYIALANGGYRPGTGAFSGCSSLKAVNVYATEGVQEPVYFSEDGVLFYKISDEEDGDVELVYYPYAKTVDGGRYVMHSEVSDECEFDAFGTPLTHAVTTIPAQVFRDRNVKTIVIPSSVTLVSASAFYNTSLTAIIFEEGSGDALTIEDGAFSNCTSLKDITLPARYTTFDAQTFSDCIALENIYVEEGGKYTSDGGLLLEDGGFTLVYYPLGRTGDVVTANLTSGNITKIRDEAFLNNTNVTTLTVSAMVSCIGASAFEGCSNLTTVTFEGTNTSPDLTIEARAFYNCVRLTSLTLPTNLTVMEANAFGGCANLTEVYFDARYGSTSSSLHFAEDSFGAYSYVKTLTLGVNVPELDFAEIFGDEQLFEVVFEVIDNGDGTYTTNRNYYSDDYGAVYNAQMTTIIYFPSARGGDYELLETTTNIGSNVFAGNTGLTSIKIGKNVNTIGTDAFKGCGGLGNIYVDAENINYGNQIDSDGNHDGVLYAKDTTTGDLIELICCPSAYSDKTEMVVTSTVTKVADYAFMNNNAVKSVKFEAEKVTYLGKYAFYECSNLETVEISGSFTEIGEYTFYNCQNLSSLAIPSTVTKIGTYAFYYCKKLTGDLTNTDGSEDVTWIVLPEGLATIGSYAFYYCQTLAVTIPSTVYSIGDYAFSHCWYSSPASGKPVVFASAEEGKAEVELTIGEYAFESVAAGSTEIPARLVSAETRAFSSFGSSSSSVTVAITFEEGSRLTTISDYMFWGCNAVSINIPASVTEIGIWAFYNSDLTSVTFGSEDEPSRLESIGEDAFQLCPLESVVIPASVQTLGRLAFGGNSSGDVSLSKGISFEENSNLMSIGNLAFQYTGITEIEIPASVMSIGEQAFRNCESLEKVSFGANSSLTQIGNYCFQECTALKDVTLPDGLIQTGDGSKNGVFYKCTALAEITIPASVQVINRYTFDGCTSLATVSFEGGCSLSEIGDYAFNGCVAMTSFTFPDSSSDIKLGTGIFTGTSVTSVTLSSSVKDLGGSLVGASVTDINLTGGNTTFTLDESGQVLYGETSIAYVLGTVTGDITIPSNITGISGSAFSGQTELTGVTFEATEVVISVDAFYGCTSLEKVTFAENTTSLSLGEYAFYGCTALADINLPDCVTEIPAYCFYNSSLANTTLPSYITTIDEYAFYGSSLPAVDLPYLSDIGTYAFHSSGLISLKFGEEAAGITTGDRAFRECTALEEIILPDCMLSIGVYMFYGCTSLEYVELPVNVASTNSYAFCGCTSLTEVIFPASFNSVGISTFQNCSSLKSCMLPDGVTTINNYAFYGCSSLESFSFPKSVKTVGNCAFQSCTSLESVDMDSTSTTLGNYAFASTGLTSVTVGKGITSMGTYTFQKCTSLVYAYTGDSVTGLQDRTFSECSKLETVEFGAGLKTMGTYEFYKCSSLKNVYLNNGLQELGNYCFSECEALESIVIPSTVATLGTYVFNKCYALKDVTLNNGLNEIGNYCFAYITALESIVLPSTVTSLGTYVFRECTALKNVTLNEGLNSIDGDCFYKCTAIKSIVIPSTVTYVGKDAFYNVGAIIYVENTEAFVTANWYTNSGWIASSANYRKATVYYYTETAPEEGDSGNYWHYDDDGAPVAW